MKSAIELAMEKVAKMPKIEAKDIEGQKQSEMREKGEGLVNRLLNGSLRTKNLKNELSKIPEEGLKFVKTAMLDTLKTAVSLEDPSINQLVFEIILLIDGNANVDVINEKLSPLIDDFQQQKQLLYATLVKEERNRLREKGISGSGMIPNVYETELWEMRLNELATDYRDKLSDVFDLFPRF